MVLWFSLHTIIFPFPSFSVATTVQSVCPPPRKPPPLFIIRRKLANTRFSPPPPTPNTCSPRCPAACSCGRWREHRHIYSKKRFAIPQQQLQSSSSTFTYVRRQARTVGRAHAMSKLSPREVPWWFGWVCSEREDVGLLKSYVNLSTILIPAGHIAHRQDTHAAHAGQQLTFGWFDASLLPRERGCKSQRVPTSNTGGVHKLTSEPPRDR